MKNSGNLPSGQAISAQITDELDLSQYQFRSTFTSVAKIVAPEEVIGGNSAMKESGGENSAILDEAKASLLSLASLAPLSGLLPEDIDPRKSPDLLYIASNGAVAGMFNRNGDGIDCETAIRINQTGKNKFISTDHDRAQMRGVVLYPGFTEIETNRPITAEEALAANKPFNMSFAGVLWKVVEPLLSKYIYKSGDSVDSDVLSMSWEIAYTSYDIGLGSDVISECERVKSDDSRFEGYSKLLLSKGGPGKDIGGKKVSKIITGNPIILGYSIVPNPAAEVKGVLGLPVQPTTPSAPTSPGAEQNKDKASSSAEIIEPQSTLIEENVNISNSFITSSNTCVTSTTGKNTPMIIKDLEQIEKEWDAIVKSENASASVHSFIVEQIKQHSEDFANKIKNEQDIVKTVEAQKADAEKRATDLEASLAAIRKELDEVRLTAKAAEEQSKYNERMAEFDELYELDDEDRQVIASDIRGQTEEAYAKYKKNAKVLMKEKSKDRIAAKKKEEEEKVKAAKAAKIAKKGEKSVEKCDDEDEDEEEETKASEAFASVTAVAGQSALLGDALVNKELMLEMRAAFTSAVKIDGKAISAKA